MSAFLVEKKTIDRILSLLSSECWKAEFFKRELAKELSVDFSDYEWRDKLGQKMWDLSWRLGTGMETKKRYLIILFLMYRGW